jgi:PAS domain S-box-containing protein
MSDWQANQSQWPLGDGEMAYRIHAHDWAATPLGPIKGWPQSLRTAVDMVLAMPGPASILWGPTHAQIYNDAYITIARDRHPALLSRPVAEGWPDVYATVIAPLLEGALAGRATRLTDFPAALRGPDGRPEERVFDTDWSPIRGEAGSIAGVLQTLAEATDRRRAEARLRESEARHRLLIESWAQAVWETDANGVVIADSPSWRAYTGQTLKEWLGSGWLDAVHPDNRASAERQWREAVPAHGPFDAEYRLRAPGGGWRWTNVRAAPVLDAEGHVEKWVGMNIDIDARKRAEAALRESEARLQVVVSELQHRTRNLLAVVRSIARRSLALSPERQAFDVRLALLGRVQGFLSQSETWSVPLYELVEAELAGVGEEKLGRTTVSGPPVELRGDKVQTIALALHELVTNAAKYGVLKQPQGRMAVTWRLEQGGDRAERLVLNWRESGMEMPPGSPAHRGFGTTLLEEALPYQLGAEVSREFTPDGVHCTIILSIGVLQRGGETV